MHLWIAPLSTVMLSLPTVLLASCASPRPTRGSTKPTAAGNGPLPQPPSQVATLENDWVSIAVSRASGSILQLQNKVARLRLMTDPVERPPPWRLYTLDPLSGEVREWEGWQEFALTTYQMADGGDQAKLHWQLAQGLEIEATVKLSPSSRDVDLHVEVRNTSQITIQQLEFPVLRGIGRLVESPTGNNLLLHPVAGGLLFTDPVGLFAGSPSESRGLRHIPYPEGIGAFAQFMAYYARDVGGFYLACHDPLNTAKEIDFYSPSGTGGLETLFTHKSWNMRPGKSLILEYPIVLGVLESGSWHEAADRYRDWATGTGEGHPDWCGAGRLKDRVHEGTAARWLSEKVGFCTFGLPSSFNVSQWLNAFHRIAERPVFHVLGHDWPQWAGASIERTARLDSMFQEAGLRSFHEYSLNELWLSQSAVPLGSLGTAQGIRQFFEMIGANWSDLAERRWREIFCEYNRCGPWLPSDTSPLPWFPVRFDPSNLEAIRKNGDYFAPFFFDFFAYGHDHRSYGMNQGDPTGWQLPGEVVQAGFAKIWMDPTTPHWQDFHAARDRRIVEESGADGLYYDISAGCGPRWCDRDTPEHPPGYGRWMWDGYAEVYRRSKQAACEARGRYVAQGTEMGVENLIRYVDFCQWRAGGLVQGDIELMPFMEWIKEGRAIKLPLFSYLYHEYGPVILDGWAKLSAEFGDVFYLIAAQVALQQGGLVELNYEYSPLERFPGMDGPTYQLMYHTAIYAEQEPCEVDLRKVAFLREIASARTEFATRYLAYGKAMEPVRFLTEIPQIDLEWNHFNSIGGRRERGVFPSPSVVHQVWNYRDERLGVVLVNLDRKSSLGVEFTLDPENYGLRGGRYSIFQIRSDRRKKIGTWTRHEPLTLSIDLPARRIILVELIPEAVGGSGG